MPFDFEEEIHDPNEGTFIGTTEHHIQLLPKSTSITGGLLFGAQWKIAKKVHLDWWMLGPHFGRTTWEIVGKKLLSKKRTRIIT